MITTLAKIGAGHTIQIIPDYDGAGNVSVTVLLTTKDEKKKVRSFCISGPVAEVEQALPGQLDAAATKIVELTNNLTDLDKQIEAAKQEKAKELEAAKAKPAAPAAKAKPATTVPPKPKASSIPPKPKAEPKPAPEPKPAEPKNVVSSLGSLFDDL